MGGGLQLPAQGEPPLPARLREQNVEVDAGNAGEPFLPSWPCRRPWPQLPQQAMGFLPERQSNSSSAQFLHFLPSMLSPPEHNLTCQLRLIVLNRTKALKVSALGFVLRL